MKIVYIYLIEDINDLKYVGSTIQKIQDRLQGHKDDKYRNRNYSSSKLNLDYCIIKVLEETTEDLRKEKERYYINNIDCVNINKLNYDKSAGDREYYKNNPRTQEQKDRANFLRRERRKLKKAL